MNPLQIVRGACGHDCPDTCSWLVEVAGGRAQKLYGDPHHPFTRGTLCAKVNHYIDRVYRPDRILHPLKRTGAKGSGQFIPVSWDEALADIAARWHAITAESGAEAILPYSLAGNQGLIQCASLDQRLFGSMGCTRLQRDICGTVATAGITATQGTGNGIDPEDIVHSRFIVLWGTNTIVTNLHLWPIILEAQRRGAKIVVIDPIRTRTAAAADWHLPIKPASDAAFALAVIHVMVRDGLVDLDYVNAHATGYEALALHVRDFSPVRVAPITGLPEADIESFARQYATASPSLIRPLIGLEHHHNGPMLYRAIACLPVLSGAWRHRGGGLFRSSGALQFSLLNLENLFLPQHHRPGVRSLNMCDLGNDLCSSTLSPPIRSLIVYNANPALTTPNQNRIRQGLLRPDLFTVVHELFLTETARYADYVLPATSQLEHLDIVPAWGHHYLSFNSPAIAPLGQAVSNTELFRRLARALGRTEPWLFHSDEQLLRDALASSHPALAGITFESLRANGYARLQFPADWRPFANGGFPTPSGKAELFSESLHAQGLGGLPQPGDIRQGPPGTLQLITGKSLHFLNAGYNDALPHSRRQGPLTIDVHPDDAAARQLFTGAAVRVANHAGSLTALCRVTTAVRPGVVSIPFGASTDAAGLPLTVNALTPEEPASWAGGSGFYDAFVELTAAPRPAIANPRPAIAIE